MYRVLIDFHDRINKGEMPIMYALIETDLGWRAYGLKELRGTFDPAGQMADGSANTESSLYAGSTSLGTIDRQGLVLDFGSFERSISAKTRDVLGSLEQKQLQHASITLSNHDHYFTKMFPNEPFLGKPLSIYFGFEGDSWGNHFPVFKGAVSEIDFQSNKIILTADER